MTYTYEQPVVIVKSMYKTFLCTAAQQQKNVGSIDDRTTGADGPRCIRVSTQGTHHWKARKIRGKKTKKLCTYLHYMYLGVQGVVHLPDDKVMAASSVTQAQKEQVN